MKSKNEYKRIKYLIYILAIVITALMIPSCSVSSSDNDSDLTIDYEMTTTTSASIDMEATNTEEALYESTTNETKTEFDSLRSELEYNHGKMISYEELKYRNWSVFAKEDSPKNWAFFIDFTEDTSVEENIEIAEQDINAIKTLENIEMVHMFWFDINGDILGWSVFHLNQDVIEFTPDIIEWLNDDYKKAYSTLHSDDEEQSQVTSNDESTLSETEINEPFTTAEAEKSTVTIGQKNALDSAKSYLRLMAFSYEGIIKQLEYEGFSNSEAVYAADNCEADWNEQALKSAKSYLDIMSFSYDGLVEQLEYEGFTHEQAVYGADNCGLNSKDQVLESALLYLKTSAFSYTGLIEQLEYEGFSHEDAVSAADRCGADWNEQAAKSAETYLKIMDFSKSELIEQLEFEGFTYAQAVYGVEANGL